MGRKIATLLAGLSLIAAVPAIAQAQDEIKLALRDTEIQTNRSTYVSLVNCRTPTVATSPGFARPVKLEPAVAAGGVGGVAQVGDKVGDYTVTAECDGKAYTAQFTVVAPPPPNWGLYPREVAPGGTINATTERWSCSPSLTSPGFAEPFGFGIEGALFRGHAKVITRPGTYTATLLCADNPNPYYEQFTIKGTPRPKAPPIVIPPGAL